MAAVEAKVERRDCFSKKEREKREIRSVVTTTTTATPIPLLLSAFVGSDFLFITFLCVSATEST